ncbi:MAG: recombinase zinc beta ribbon domain-containing protein [Candidatus Pacebacteria bacterium]|nr:recombinase zinc beta ribbon domain-containing protein [Candidatus Paceibacterota bacterium]
MLVNPFYAGIITYNGKESKGKHKPLITIDEHNRIRQLLGERGGNRKPSKRDFLFGGMFKCGFCGCAITAEHKNKFIKCDKKIKEYEYYHCTHKKKEIKCKEGSVEENIISDDIISKLERLEMHPKFLEWALEHLDQQKGVEKVKNNAVEQSVAKEAEKIKAEISGLNKMRARDVIDDEEYLKEKEILKKQLDKLQQKTETKEDVERIIELTKEKYIFCAYARKRYLNGDENVKREILEDLGSNREIKDKKVLISLEKWFIPIYLMTKKHNEEMARLEPEKFGYDYNKNEALYRLRSSWLRGLGSNQRNPR